MTEPPIGETTADEAGRDDRAAGLVERPSNGAQDVIDAVELLGAEGIFHKYQKEAVAWSHLVELLVVEKSRRVGITWAFAGDDVVTSATARGQGGDNTLYISYSQDMAREYIDACAGFAKAFYGIDVQVGEFMFEDRVGSEPESRKIQAFRIEFASGFTIQALSSAPRSLRGKQGRVRIDEGAFVDNLEELLKAALALVMLGSSVVVMSSHNGIDNAFNKLIHEIRAGEREGKVMTITFADAVADGMYERQAKIKGWPLTAEGREAWVAKIRKLYGSAAAEELDCIPSKGSGAWLTYDEIERAERKGIPVLRLSFDDAFARQPDHLRTAQVQEWCEANLLPLIMTFTAQDRIAVGGDFARFVDLSVIWPLKELQDRTLTTPFVVEMRNVPFTEQEFVWKYLLKRLRRWIAAIDAQGNGAYLAERLWQAFGELRVLKVVSTQAGWWRDNGPPVKQGFQDERFEIPADADTSADLRAVKVVDGVPAIPKERKTAKGEDAAAAKAAFKRHADAAVAFVLAVFAQRQGIGVEFEFMSAGRTGLAANPTIEDRGFGVVASEIQLPGY